MQSDSKKFKNIEEKLILNFFMAQTQKISKRVSDNKMYPYIIPSCSLCKFYGDPIFEGEF